MLYAESDYFDFFLSFFFLKQRREAGKWGRGLAQDEVVKLVHSGPPQATVRAVTPIPRWCWAQ